MTEHGVVVAGRSGFEPGSLLDTVKEISARALAAGTLVSIPTGSEFVEDGGVRFLVRVLANLARKDLDRWKRERDAATGKPANPFLPFEPGLFVANVSDTHVAILNKFNVVDHHLLIVTRAFEDQRALLTLRDFEALWLCLKEYESLGFYNGGAAAGASQPHKHLQLVPLPLAPVGPAVPIEPLLSLTRGAGAITRVPGFDFRHAFVRFRAVGGAGDPEGARTAHDHYRALLEEVGLQPQSGADAKLQRGPYCLLATREWLLLVPRSREFFDSISINSLGFAGALLVRDEAQLQALKAAGPLRALGETAYPAAAAAKSLSFD